MRVHITLDDELVGRLDQRVGARRRSRFVAEAVRRALDDQERWDAITAAIGSVATEDHEWDQDLGSWVRGQRRDDSRKVG